ncbi:WSC domain-containing protein [Astrocystis sublimbata]|nr:WSC domain-containing protein [Astrocystis sublimbata]
MWFPSLLSLTLLGTAAAQQYQGTPYDNQMSNVPGSEKVFWKITDKKGRTFSQLNYFSQNGNGQKLKTPDVKRVVLIVHGLNRDPDTYMSNALSALSQNSDGPANFANTQIIAPMFPTGDDKVRGYPWDYTAPAGGYGSTSNALVWKGSGWMSGDNNQYPRLQIATSSYDCLDQIIQYFGNKTLYPNLNQIVVAGHSAGAQTVQRYASVSKDMSSSLGKTRLTYWIGNPNSWLWFNTSRPLDPSTCSVYDDWRNGLSNYSPSYNTDLVARGGDAVRANYQSKSIAYLRSLQDFGDDSSDCAPFTQGGNRDERFFNFIASFPPTCRGASDAACDTIDYIEAGHDAGAAFASSSGRARLFNDNFDGSLNRAKDFYCPRQAQGDSPFPDATCKTIASDTPTGAYNGMTYQGCFSDEGTTRTLGSFLYNDDGNTVDLCTSTCAQKGYKLAGMEYGSECYCGNKVAAGTQRVGDRGCSTTCPGNSTQRCGTNHRVSIWGTSAPVQVIPARAPPTVGDYQYAGCYLDSNPSRALASKQTASSDMTNGACATFCSGYKYFATEYSSECYCGDIVAPGNTKAASADCSMVCAGDDSQLCGAGNRLTLYAINGTAVEFGQTTTTTTTTSKTGPTTTPDKGPACPASDNSLYQSADASFEVHCGIDYAGGDIGALNANTFGGCIDACASTAGCKAVAYVGASCYLKGSIGAPNPNGAVWGARVAASSLTSSTTSTTSASTTTTTTTTTQVTNTPTSLPPGNPVCPASDGAIYQSGADNSFEVHCGIDYSGNDIAAYDGVATFAKCMDKCSTTGGCSAVAYLGQSCYLKGSVGAPNRNGGVWGAKIVASTTTSSSTSTSPTTPSTTSASTASSSPVTCPGSDGKTYTASSGEEFLLQCGTDHAGGDIGALGLGSYQECLEACARRDGCVALAHIGGACYLKGSIGAEVKNGVSGAILKSAATTTTTTTTTATATASPAPVVTSISCPASNQTTYTSAGGDDFVVECGKDFAGGDLKGLSASTFAGCLDACSNTDGCVALAYVGNACYLKSKLNAPVLNGVWGARLATPGSPSTTTTTRVATNPASTFATSTTPRPTSTSVAVTCPADDGKTYTASTGTRFNVQCGTDHAGGDMPSPNPAYVSDFTSCLETCAKREGCMSVALAGGACYLKGSVGAPIQNGVFGAVVVS